MESEEDSLDLDLNLDFGLEDFLDGEEDGSSGKSSWKRDWTGGLEVGGVGAVAVAVREEEDEGG